MTCQIATVLSALLAVGSAQAADGSAQSELRTPAPVKAVASAPKKPVRLDAQGRAVLKHSSVVKSGSGAGAGY